MTHAASHTRTRLKSRPVAIGRIFRARNAMFRQGIPEVFREGNRVFVAEKDPENRGSSLQPTFEMGSTTREEKRSFGVENGPR